MPSQAYGVDVFFGGHQHSYQRTLPVDNDGNSVDTTSCGPAPYTACTSPAYPIYVTNGAGGDSLYTDTSLCGVPVPANRGAWRGQIVVGEYGTVKATVQGTTMTIRFVTEDGVILDEAVITK